MIMKRLIISLIALFALSSADAQILDALKKVATEAVTEVVDNATDGALTQLAIIGTWSYTAPAVKLDGEDTLTSLSGSALSATLGKKLESAFTKVGITADACSVTFNSDGTFTMPIKNRNLTGTYTYNSEDHSFIMVVGQIKSIEMKGYAFINGTTGLQLVFPVNKLTSFLTSLGSSISSLTTLTALVKQYENIYLGFEFAK